MSLAIYKAPVGKIFAIKKYPKKSIRKIGQYSCSQRLQKILYYKQKKLSFKKREQKKIEFE